MKRHKIRSLDFILYSLMLLVTIIFLFSLDYTGKEPLVVITFCIIGVFSFCRIMLFRGNISILRTMYIFVFIFLFMAPLQQYTSGTVLWRANGMSLVYGNDDYLYANVLVLLFCFIVELAYRRPRKAWTKEGKKNEIRSKWSIRVLVIVAMLCMMIAVVTNGLNSLINASALLIQIRNMILFVPAECLLISLGSWMRTKDKKLKVYIGILAAVCGVVYLGYSDVMGRFMSLGVLMAIVSFILLENKNKSIFPFLYFFGFLFVFTAFRGNGFLETNLSFKTSFIHADFDAYQMFLMTVKYVKHNGVSWGMNILSALLCFIPRSAAPWRLEATGGIVVGSFGSWFKNVSCPLPAECYFAFGIVGVLVLGYGIGVLMKKTDALIGVGNEFATGLFCLLAGMTIYIMRGALLPAFSYTFGMLLSYWALYRVTHSVT